jgi:hypothetical protein
MNNTDHFKWRLRDTLQQSVTWDESVKCDEDSYTDETRAEWLLYCADISWLTVLYLPQLTDCTVPNSADRLYCAYLSWLTVLYLPQLADWLCLPQLTDCTVPTSPDWLLCLPQLADCTVTTSADYCAYLSWLLSFWSFIQLTTTCLTSTSSPG